MIITAKTCQEVRQQVKEWKQNGLTIGLVPTMGALHAGHASLIKKSVEKCDKTIVSVFVNPTQFGINEDFSKYPRTLENDTKLANEIGADMVFCPSAEEMYGSNYDKNFLTLVCPPYDLVNKLCGKTRIGHFDGVATVVTKLFNIVQPDFAFFGEKDAQQLYIIKKMVKDLSMPIDIIPCPIVREPNNLAMSSRNQYLSEAEKEKALCLSKALFTIKDYYQKGVNNVSALTDTAMSLIPTDVEVEYLDFLDYKTFEKTAIIKEKTLVAICVKIGKTRLIDNITLEE